MANLDPREVVWGHKMTGNVRKVLVKMSEKGLDHFSLM